MIALLVFLVIGLAFAAGVGLMAALVAHHPPTLAPRQDPGGLAVDIAEMFPELPKVRFPPPYPGETAAEHAVRTGHPRNAGSVPPDRVWSDLRRAWIVAPANPLPPGSRVDPIDGETAGAYQERRESLGVFQPCGLVADEWTWNQKANKGEGSFLPAGACPYCRGPCSGVCSEV